MKRKVFVVITAITLLTSCMTTRTTVGEGPVGKDGHKKVYSRTKQVYLFWGFMSLGSSQSTIPNHGNVQIKTSYNVTDAFVTGLTGGLFAIQTIKVLVKKEDIIKYDNIANKNIQSGKKIIFMSSREQMVGDVISIDNTKGKAKIKYLNSYGEVKYKDEKFEKLNVISGEEYQKSLSKQTVEIQKHKFKNNEKATWIKNNEPYFGKIIMMDDKVHKANIEYLNVFHEKELSKIDYLELNKLSEEKYVEMLKFQQIKEEKYKFEVGEKVRYKSLKGEGEGIIIILDEVSHKATIDFVNSKNVNKTITISYLKVFKK